MKWLINRFILWAISRDRTPRVIITYGGDFLFRRYEFVRIDELPDKQWNEFRDRCTVRPHALPWWCPVNAFLHHWRPADELREAMHDHPRWSITVCLRGKIIEHTPWGSRTLTPGSVVIRSHKAIHAFEVPAEFRGKTWTLFIVGRRKHGQNTYQVFPKQ